MYPYFTTDETALKTVVRSNPGLVLLKEGTVVNMWHHNDVPTFSEMK
jgi:triosephosphate isomerase